MQFVSFHRSAVERLPLVVTPVISSFSPPLGENMLTDYTKCGSCHFLLSLHRSPPAFSAEAAVFPSLSREKRSGSGASLQQLERALTHRLTS